MFHKQNNHNQSGKKKKKKNGDFALVPRKREKNISEKENIEKQKICSQSELREYTEGKGQGIIIV